MDQLFYYQHLKLVLLGISNCKNNLQKREKILLLTSTDVNPVYANMAFDWVYDNYKDDIINYGQETIKNIGKSISANNSLVLYIIKEQDLKTEIETNNLINLGWFHDNAVYYDMKTKKLYKSNLKKNSTGIMLLTPIISTIIGKIIQSISENLEISNFSILFSIVYLSLLILVSGFTVKLMRRKNDYEELEIFPGQLKKFIKDAKVHNILIISISFILSFSILLLFKLFLQVLDFNLFIILGILFVSVLILILEYRPYKRKKVLIELEKNSNSGTNI